MAEEEKVRRLMARLAELRERRDVIVARYETRLKALTEQRRGLEEERALLIRQRDEELAELETELKLLGVAS